MNIVEASGRTKKKLVQLALDIAKAKPQFPMLWSEKLDGCYCIAWKEKDSTSVSIFSRTGERYTSMKHIEAELSEAILIGDMIIFEAWCPDTKQSKISGWCREQKEQRPQLQAKCHDYIRIEDFINGGTSAEYEIRYKILKSILQYIDQDIVSVVRQIYVDNMEDAMALTDDVWDRDGEGGVLRNPNGLYGGADGTVFGTKRNSDIIKLKKGVSYDLEVVGMKCGDSKGKYSETLGKLVCRWDDGKTIQISGMTNLQRQLWWNNPEVIVGKIVQVDAMCLSSKGLLREPRFKGIREDKMEGDF